MQIVTFIVQGSAPDPYTVAFTKRGSSLFATCTCKAGFVGIHCKHRVRILAGQSDGIISGNVSAIPAILAWLQGSTLAQALSSVTTAEAEYERAKKAFSDAKKALSTAMHPAID